MTNADSVKARYKELLETSKQVGRDIVRLHESGISPDSPIYKAAEREVHRISDELIAATELHNALGTGAEEIEASYQDLVRRSMRLQDALLAVFDAGIAAGSPIHQMLEAEVDRVGNALNSATEERAAALAKR